MRIVFFSSALALCGLSNAAAPINGWYAGVFGGIAYIPDNIAITKWGLRVAHPSYDNAWNAGGRIGYKSSPLRYEGELTYVKGYLSKFRINQARQLKPDGYAAGAFVLANVYYDFPEMVPSIAPFVGIGIGYGSLTAKLSSLGPLSLIGPYSPTQFEFNESVFAYQATGGFSYNVGSNCTVDLAYRYIQTQHADAIGKVFQAHLISVGFAYRFDRVSDK